MDKTISPLQKAIATLGGDKAFCSALGITIQRLAYWLKKGKPPPEFCPPIERLTRAAGLAVVCEQLDSDVEWSVLRLQAKENA